MTNHKTRVFIYADLVRELRKLSKKETGHTFGQNSATPLYVMLNLAQPAHGIFDIEFDDPLDFPVEGDDLEELLLDEDDDLIEELDSHPELFRTVPFELEDGSDAVAYDFAKRSIYTMHRVQDQADWLLAMRTYDPTWLAGPAIPKLPRMANTKRKRARRTVHAFAQGKTRCDK